MSTEKPSFNNEKNPFDAIAAENRGKKTLEATANNETEKNGLTPEALKRVGFGLGVSVIAGGIVTAALLGGGAGNNGNNGQNTQPTTTATETMEETTGFEKLYGLLDQSFEQDGSIGCCNYNPQEKISPTSVGNPRAIAEYIGINLDTATPEELGKINEYIVRAMKYPAAAFAISHGYQGFEGLTQLEAEQKIANMSEIEKIRLDDFIVDECENATYHEEYGEGTMVNHGVEDGHSIGAEVDLTGVKLLVRTVYHEDGTTIIDYIKEDCENWVGTIIRHPNGYVDYIFPPQQYEPVTTTYTPEEPTYTPQYEIPTYPAPEYEPPTTYVPPEYETTTTTVEVPPEIIPDIPTDDPEPETTTYEIPNYPEPETTTNEPEAPAPKNLEAEKENAGPVVTPLELNEDVTPKTDKKDDTANFDAIAQQQAEDAARAEEAARIAAEQEAAQKQAEIEAAQRRQAEEAQKQAELEQMEEEARLQREAAEAEAKRKADEAAAAAAAQAAADQAAANTAAQANAADEAARNAAQEQANAAAPANDVESTNNDGATANDRIGMFEGGDF